MVHTSKWLIQEQLGCGDLEGLVLGNSFRTENVSCVPSLLGPHLLSNGTGIHGVDLKYRMAHLSSSSEKFRKRKKKFTAGVSCNGEREQRKV